GVVALYVGVDRVDGAVTSRPGGDVDRQIVVLGAGCVVVGLFFQLGRNDPVEPLLRLVEDLAGLSVRVLIRIECVLCRVRDRWLILCFSPLRGGLFAFGGPIRLVGAAVGAHLVSRPVQNGGQQRRINL